MRKLGSKRLWTQDVLGLVGSVSRKQPCAVKAIQKRTLENVAAGLPGNLECLADMHVLVHTACKQCDNVTMSICKVMSLAVMQSARLQDNSGSLCAVNACCQRGEHAAKPNQTHSMRRIDSKHKTARN